MSNFCENEAFLRKYRKFVSVSLNKGLHFEVRGARWRETWHFPKVLFGKSALRWLCISSKIYVVL